MLTAALATALLLQLPDTLRPVFDSPATEGLVVRAIEASGEVPAELRDYRAEVHTTMNISIAADTLAAADLPASVDELVSVVRWERRGFLHQEVRGHRVQMLVPLPYTLATIFESAWVVPHLYGARIYAPLGGPPAVNPFSASGPQYYRYESGDTIHIRLPDELVTLVPVHVRPRVRADQVDLQLLVGTFYVDTRRGAVARARLGFVGRDRLLPRALGQVETFLELENGLWEGRFWLPFRQRRDILFDSRLMGGAVAARVVNRFVDLQLNTGWQPTGDLVRLDWNLVEPRTAFAGWRGGIGDEEAALSVDDFADLRLATAAEARPGDAVRAHVHYERGGHLFRYNRVEGAFLGLGARLIPPSPRRDRWELYGTGGWAFAEGTPRGELSFRRGAAMAPLPTLETDWGLEAALYRRLRDLQPFRPTFMWDWFYTFPAVLWGSDPRDYYDAAGGDLSTILRRGRWSGRATGRWERHDSVGVHTQRFLFGLTEEFGPVIEAEPGNHLALEVGSQYALGPGAFGIGNSLLARAEAEAGLGDFRFGRLNGLLSVRYALGPLTFAARTDAGHAWGSTLPPQKLFRFGAVEGLRGYEPNEFGGSSAVLTRGRLLLGIPPRTSRPLYRAGLWVIPPLRPALVAFVEAGHAHVDPDLTSELQRLHARPTDGWRTSVGFGLSLLDDALTIERIQPVREEEERPARWYVGLTYWY